MASTGQNTKTYAFWGGSGSITENDTTDEQEQGTFCRQMMNHTCTILYPGWMYKKQVFLVPVHISRMEADKQNSNCVGILRCGRIIFSTEKSYFINVESYVENDISCLKI
jgi:hypothetical protein